jgi:hypothetical protein
MPHLSAGRIYVPQRYVVGWPEGIVKIGSTSDGKKRWGPLLARGAVMIDLAFYPCFIEALEAEVWLRRQARARYEQAFATREEAEEHLGKGGAGYSECFRIPTAEWPDFARLAGGLT